MKYIGSLMYMVKSMSDRTFKQNRVHIRFANSSRETEHPYESKQFFLLFILIALVLPWQCVIVFMLGIYFQVVQMQAVILLVPRAIDDPSMDAWLLCLKFRRVESLDTSVRFSY